MALSNTEQRIILEALKRSGNKGLTSHQAYRLLPERQGLLKSQLKDFLAKIGSLRTDLFGNPLKHGMGRAHVYVYDPIKAAEICQRLNIGGNSHAAHSAQYD